MNTQPTNNIKMPKTLNFWIGYLLCTNRVMLEDKYPLNEHNNGSNN